MNEETRTKMGEIATVARHITGGRCITSGRNIQPCSVVNIAELCIQLRKVLDEYDDLVISESKQ